MKRAFVAALCLALGVAAGAASLSSKPLYGDGVQTEAQLAKRRQVLLAAAAKAGQDAHEASEARAQAGWKQVEGKHYAAAMAAFNEAWLLDARNGDAYYGLATVVLRRDRDARGAEHLYQLAVEQPGASPNVFVDYGQLLLSL
ncbi:hypothetical protein E4K72_03060, partial [Oxalobacteraceae bacterium OM1]